MKEPWLRGVPADPDPIRSQVLHSLTQALEDIEHWIGGLTDAQVNELKGKIASVSFQVKHIVGSIDRLLTYASGNSLSREQFSFLRDESQTGETAEGLIVLAKQGIATAFEKVRTISPDSFDAPVFIGRERIPTTVGSVLIHVSEHTQRHVGELIITVKAITRDATS